MLFFVSSTFQDMRQERESAQEALRAMSAVPWGNGVLRLRTGRGFGCLSSHSAESAHTQALGPYASAGLLKLLVPRDGKFVSTKLVASSEPF